MDEAPNGDMNMDNHGTRGFFSTMSLDNEFDFNVDIDISELYGLIQEPSMNTDIIPSTSIENDAPNHQNSDIPEIPHDLFLNEQPVTTNIIPSSSSNETGDKNSSSRRTYQITLDEGDGYSLSYIHSMGVKYISKLREEEGTNKISTSDGKDQENPKTNDLISMPILMEKEGDIHISSRREQENPRTNVMIPQQPMPKIPILEQLQREFMKSNFTIDHPFGISTSRMWEQVNPNTNGLILQQPMPNIPTLDKLKSDFMKSKLTIDHPFGTSISWMEEQGNPRTNGLVLQQSMSNIPVLEKLKSDFMNPKMLGHPFGTPIRRMEEKYEEIDSDGFKTVGPSNKVDEIHCGISNSLDDVPFPQKSSFNGGPIRSSNKTSSRYQPFERQTPNKQGLDRDPQSSLESTFNRSPQVREDSIIYKWKNHLEEIKRKTGIGGDFARSSYHTHKILNYMQKQSQSSEVAETEKLNSYNEEVLVGGRSSKTVNHSNWNFQHSPTNTHDINDKFKGVVGGQNVNQGTQGYDYADQAITLGRWNKWINEDGAHDQLQSSGVQNFNADYTHFNWP